jgi:hypothetical protein
MCTIGAAGLIPALASAASPDAGACIVHAPEAASRSGLPVDVVLRVMKAESGGNPRAVSPKGAMGCMQIMPRTWVYLSGRYALGRDAFEPRANMIAGALYLAELAKRFGFPGAFSAYNAGPGRYERYAAGRSSLPAETVAYTARVGRGGAAHSAPDTVAPAPSPAVAPVSRWQEATLFLARRVSFIDRSTARTTDPGNARVSANVLFPLVANVEPSPR